MNLYKIVFSHAAPKDVERGIKGYVIADNDEAVYSYVDDRYKYNYDNWANVGGETFSIYDDTYQSICNVRFKGYYLDEDCSTYFGWALIKAVDLDEIKVLLDLGIAEDI